MKEAENITPISIRTLGQYVHIKCDKCGKTNGNWTQSTISYADCDCTLFETGSYWRTQARVKLINKTI